MAVTDTLITLLAGRRIELPASVVERHPELLEARYRRGGLGPRLGGWGLGRASVSAITLGRTVILGPNAPFDVGLLLHELAHVRQFATVPLFPLLYLWESLWRGYRSNRYEREADAFAIDALRRADSDSFPLPGA